jgi:hypothetical protein
MHTVRRTAEYDLETVDLDVVLARNLLLDQEGADSLALVALELENLLFAVLVLQHRAVAAMLFLDRLEDLLEVKRLREASHGGNRLAPVALLDTNVDVALVELAAGFGVRCVRKRICTRGDC